MSFKLVSFLHLYHLMVKSRNFGTVVMLAGSFTRNFRHFRWCGFGRILLK